MTDDAPLAIRAGTIDDFDAVAHLLFWVFHEAFDAETYKIDRGVFEPRRSLAATEGTAVVGHAGAFTRDLTVPGEVVSAAHVTMGGVAPTHRRRGVLTRMMRRQPPDIGAGREPLTVLWASEGRDLSTVRLRPGVRRTRSRSGLPRRHAAGRAGRRGTRTRAAPGRAGRGGHGVRLAPGTGHRAASRSSDRERRRGTVGRMADTGRRRQRQRQRHVHDNPGSPRLPPRRDREPSPTGTGPGGDDYAEPDAGCWTADQHAPSARTAAVQDPDPPDTAPRTRTRAEEREAERGLRGLVGSGASQVGSSAAMRARDIARPTDTDLADAERGLVIVRRNWVPREELPRTPPPPR